MEYQRSTDDDAAYKSIVSSVLLPLSPPVSVYRQWKIVLLFLKPVGINVPLNLLIKNLKIEKVVDLTSVHSFFP